MAFARGAAPAHGAHREDHAHRRAGPLSRRVLRPDASAGAFLRQGRFDHAGQHEVLRLPVLWRKPRSEAPFLNISKGERKGHRSYSGQVYWQDETYNDSRVLVHVPEHFDAKKPGVIVVFFHGNGATLERDVRDRQMVPQQISDSGVNAVLLAPQLAVDAADSSAGKFWTPNGFKRFMDESAATSPASMAIRTRQGLCQHADRDRRL